MRHLLLFCLLLLSFTALAERKVNLAGLEVHYNVFNASYLQKNIAEAAGIMHSSQQAVVNITVLKGGTPTAVTIKGELRDLLGKKTALAFRENHYQGGVYYLAQFPIFQREILRFFIELQETGGAVQRFDFTQEIFPGV
ncbi:hypothetical protein AXE65_11080 [Ventosimonas gracilis]|uniref:DUF4426 domain-containing protein n=1 Tax=Ventosimonas gracilis TaxID=1680762 RepID=A0A139SWJ2_9GAMM|nr:DUF4426 domain-containing protein [Ventosimonas gracilis]KXU38977.1 hypothetical protein AXE65_11080 [Ventosimonas gracilis]